MLVLELVFTKGICVSLGVVRDVEGVENVTNVVGGGASLVVGGGGGGSATVCVGVCVARVVTIRGEGTVAIRVGVGSTSDCRADPMLSSAGGIERPRTCAYASGAIAALSHNSDNECVFILDRCCAAHRQHG